MRTPLEHAITEVI